MADISKVLAPAAPLAGQGIYTDGAFSLRVTTWGNTAGAIVRLSGLVMGLDGNMITFEEAKAASTDRSAVSFLVNLAQGWLIEANLLAITTPVPLGGLYARVDVVRGFSGAISPVTTIAAGVLTREQPLNYPRSGVRTSRECPGNFRVITGTNPAAGVQFSETVPAGALWRLRSVLGRVVTNATVANRQPGITVDDGAAVFMRSGINTNITASLDRTQIFAAYGMVGDMANGHAGPLPDDLFLLPGYRIIGVYGALVAGDDVAAPVLNVEERMLAE